MTQAVRWRARVAGKRPRGDQCAFDEPHREHPWGWDQSTRRARRCKGVRDDDGTESTLPVDTTQRERILKERRRAAMKRLRRETEVSQEFNDRVDREISKVFGNYETRTW